MKEQSTFQFLSGKETQIIWNLEYVEYSTVAKSNIKHFGPTSIKMLNFALFCH